ncbi:hypothetical protein IOD13_01080 [Brevibacterium casei]|nr:hypothetical protein [Brevibacterium casei]
MTLRQTIPLGGAIFDCDGILVDSGGRGSTSWPPTSTASVPVGFPRSRSGG